ncbi:PH domain-containing protein [Dactylosporangium sp. CA-139066]|uniref:PH domain-containing protein n=1 Tax=Dactylosporangium sp. CA-139066 TaxID=3239930 RepID=UPI003D8A6194
MTTVDTIATTTQTSLDGREGWRRLSPRMLLIHPVQEVIRLLPAFLGLVVASLQGGRHGYWGLLAGGVAVALGILRYFTTSYRITVTHVQVRRGFFRRRVLTVPRDRVRTVDVSAHLLHRLLGLARVTIGTGQTDKRNDGVKLDGVGAAEAENLHRELLHRSEIPGVPEAAPVVDANPETELVRLDPAWVRYGPFTLSGLVTVGVLLAFGQRFVNEGHVNLSKIGFVRRSVDQLLSISLPLAILEVLAAAVVFVAIASTVGYVLAFWGFRLTRHRSGTLHVRRGLITTRSTTIEERRLRGVEVSEPLLLRTVRGARVLGIATGLRVGRGAERGGSLLLPPAPRTEAARVAALVLGDPAAITAPLTPHGPRARRRRYNRALLAAAMIIVACALLGWSGRFPWWPAAASLSLLPIAALLATDRSASLGHTIADGSLISRYGSVVRRRIALRTDAIIGWNIRETFFQRRAGLATLVATTAGGNQSYPVIDVPAEEALRLARAAVPGLLEQFLEAPAGVQLTRGPSAGRPNDRARP